MVFVQAHNWLCPCFGSGRTWLLRFLLQRHHSRQSRCTRIIPEKFVAGVGMFPGEHTRAPTLACSTVIRATDSANACSFSNQRKLHAAFPQEQRTAQTLSLTQGRRRPCSFSPRLR